MNDVKESKFISAVVYMHNVANDIGAFLKALVSQLETNFWKYEIILVDDASVDGSDRVVENVIKEIKDAKIVSLVKMGYFQGIEMAMSAGVDLAVGDYVYQFDTIYADYDWEMLMSAYRSVLSGVDIVMVGPSTISGFGSRVFYRIFNLTNLGTGRYGRISFFLLTRRAINRVLDMYGMLLYRKAVYMNCGLSVLMLEYKNSVNQRKKSAEETGRRFRLGIEVLMVYSDVIHKAAFGISVLFFLFAMLSGVYTCVIYFGKSRPVEGWAPLMGVLSVGFSGIFVLMAMLIKYMGLVLETLFTKKRYIIKSVEKIVNCEMVK